LVSGGNLNLKPERAESWAATLEYQPHQVPGLRLQGSYFSTVYKDRIVTPITYSTQALSNPLYATWASIAPSTAAIAAATANQSSFSNLTGTTYDPSKVAAIVYNTNFNAGRQMIHGIDMLLDYKAELGHDAGQIRMTGNVAYLVSSQQLIAGAATTQLAGTIFNPPHWRGSAGVTWIRGGLTINALTSAIGGVNDVRTTTTLRVGGMVTQDLTLRYAFGDRSDVLRRLAVSLTVQNMFNAKPSQIATTYFYETPYDSTNYSPVGRYIGLGVTKSW
jgi:outer membrane receptor protein involved in Fe transport